MSTPEPWPTFDEYEQRERDAGRWNDNAVQEEVSRLRATQRAHKLARIRRDRGLTQTDMAERMHVSQRRVSAIENGRLPSSEVRTLSAYVTALGGELVTLADFGDEKVVIGDES